MSGTPELRRKNLIFLGAPGAGKGTIAKEMIDKYRIAHISTGDILRGEVAAQTPAGKQAEALMKAGQLVPDELVAGMVRRRIAEPDCKRGFILDGFPRTIRQAELLEDALRELKLDIDAVLYLEVDDDTLLRRLTARLNCRKCDAIYNKISRPPKQEGVCDVCGGELFQRPDDSLETAKSRLKVFYSQTAPLVDYYRKNGLLFTVAADAIPAMMKKIAAELE
ncbi:MAG: adenylate kinase [Lentisphaeria bacterium]|nr:adenylate kinase [Lentisphaeria bacterium]